ncbi:MAG: MFS transporter [Candidatus Gracilibacteria bacterium]
MNVRSNIWKLNVGYFLTELMFFIPIWVPFLSGMGFSMEDIFILEALFAAVMVVMEIPSGYFADIYGRSTSLAVGAVFSFAGFVYFALFVGFVPFLIGQILLGIGMSFISGAQEALIYDSLIEMKEEDKYRKIQGNMFFYSRMAATISNFTGSILATISMRLPFYVAVVPFFFLMLINFTLVEPKIHKSKVEKLAHFKAILKESFVNNKALRSILFYGGFLLSFTLMTFWLYQKYMSYIDLPILYYGFVIAAANIVSGLGSKFAKEIEDKIGVGFSLIAIPISLILTWLLFFFFKSQYMLIFIVIASFFWGYLLVVVQNVIQNLVASNKRATVLSIRSMITRLSFVIFSPVLGVLTDKFNVSVAFLAPIIIVFVVGGISVFALKRNRVF